MCLPSNLRRPTLLIVEFDLDTGLVKGVHSSSSVSRFISRIEQSDYIAVIGTPLYREKYENKVSKFGSVVAA